MVRNKICTCSVQRQFFPNMFCPHWLSLWDKQLSSHGILKQPQGFTMDQGGQQQEQKDATGILWVLILLA
jgi:hypothetical protein